MLAHISSVRGDYHLSLSALVTSVFNPIPPATCSLLQKSVLQMQIRKGILLCVDPAYQELSAKSIMLTHPSYKVLKLEDW